MKRKYLALLPLAGLILSGCSIQDLMFWKKKDKGEEQKQSEYYFNPVIEGGTQEEKDAILNVINFKPICNKSGNAVTEILPDITPILSEDEGDDILVTTRQIASNNKFVDITWSVDESQTYFSKVSDVDEYHKLIELSYQHYGKPDGTIEWKISKLVCGGAVSNNPEGMTYKATTKNEAFFHEDARLADINKVTDQELVVDAKGTTHKFASTFDIVDYEYHEGKEYSPYFRTNNPEATEKQYLYYNAIGKVIYTSPDGNWGLLGDGSQVLEFYAGSGKALKETNWPNLAKKYVIMSGNMSQYCGNIQFGWLTKIKEYENHSAIAEPVLTYPEITESTLASWIVPGYTAQKQAIDGFSNSLHSVTGTLIEGSLLDKSGNAIAANKIDTMANNRFTFKLQVGAQELTVAYDYHTDREGEVGLFSNLKAALKKGGQMTIKGTMRYSGNDEGCFITEGNNGVWNIIPFLADHVA